MLRPNMVIDYAKERSMAKLSDFDQLVNGLNVGGRLVVGGDERAANLLRSVAKQQHRLGMVIGIREIQDPKLDPFHTYSFDIMATAQLLMMAKNEAFHQTVDNMLGILQRLCVDEGKKIEVGLQFLREKADEVGHL